MKQTADANEEKGSYSLARDRGVIAEDVEYEFAGDRGRVEMLLEADQVDAAGLEFGEPGTVEMLSGDGIGEHANRGALLGLLNAPYPCMSWGEKRGLSFAISSFRGTSQRMEISLVCKVCLSDARPPRSAFVSQTAT